MKYMFHFFKVINAGRACRKEFWEFFVFYIVVLDILIFIDSLVLDPIDMGEFGMWIESMLSGLSVPYLANYYEAHPEEAQGIGILPMTFGLLLTIPSFSVQIRRLHDLNLSGWGFLATLIPIIGWAWWLVLGCIKGSDGENKFGEEPQY